MIIFVFAQMNAIIALVSKTKDKMKELLLKHFVLHT